MEPVSPDYNPHSVETEVLSLWKTRRLPPAGGVLGPPTGPTVRQFAVGWSSGDFPSLVAHRAVLADVDARYLELVGRRAVGTLRQEVGRRPCVPSTVPALLTALGIWVGGDGRSPLDAENRRSGVQTLVGRLAEKGVLVTRDESFRVCPSCGMPRNPEGIVYEEQEGDTYLVRFPVRLQDLTVNVLVWVDAPWKLLGASALLVNPELRYVVAGYQRREERELVLTSAASLDRLRSWIPDATFEIVEERRGREFEGTAYVYPLRHEFPMGGDLTPPAGTILAVADVGESGTGIVPLVPGHGPTDAQIASRKGVAGWPLLTPKGMLDVTLMHKYAGLDLETANEFVLRDLTEAGAVLARLRVKRGVPYCTACGTPLLWAPGRAWCLEPSRLPPEVRATFARVLAPEALPGPTEVAPWPVSEATTSDEECAIALLECARCDRLAEPDQPSQCPCGGQRTRVRRRLLPSSDAALSACARLDPLPEGDTVRLYVGSRRRVPALVNHLAALSGIEGAVPTVSLTVVPTTAAADAAGLVATHGADAVRSALVRGGRSESAGGHFADQCRREGDRIHRWWSLSRAVVTLCDPTMLAAFARPISGFLAGLEVEDRAILARWERTRVLALAQYDQWAPALVHRYASRFLDNDLLEYWELVQPRLALPGSPATKTAALRTLVHLLRGLSQLLAPIAPFTSEAIHRSLASERASLFEQRLAGVDRALVNDELVAAWDRWRTVLRSVDRFRRSLGVPRTASLPSLVLVITTDDVADRFRAEKETLARLARAEQLEIGSPREPWMGRRRVLRPIESEIQKVYPTQASQIVHLLQRMGPRRWEATAGQESIDVVINGLPRRVFPNMLAFSNTLPDRTVPFPWPLGEMYVELPAGSEAAARPPPPPLSSDAFWLIRRTERRLRAWPSEEGRPPRIAIVTATDPLASELRLFAEPVAQYLGLSELRVVEKSEEAVPPNALTGRTRTGARWWVHVPNLPTRPTREKRPCAGVRLQRVPASARPAEAPEVDYADEKVVAHEEAVRALGQELDDIVGLPLLGPAKVAAAWEHGVHSVDDLRQSSFDTVSALPGFGGPVAEVVVAKLGGSVPGREARRARRGLAAIPPGRGPSPERVSVPAPAVPAPPSAPMPPAPPPPAVLATAPLEEAPRVATEPPPPPAISVAEVPEEVAPPPAPTPVEEVGESTAPALAEPARPLVEPAPEPTVPPVEPAASPTEAPPAEEAAVPSEPLPSEVLPPPAEPAPSPSSEISEEVAPAPEVEAPPPSEAAELAPAAPEAPPEVTPPPEVVAPTPTEERIPEAVPPEVPAEAEPAPVVETPPPEEAVVEPVPPVEPAEEEPAIRVEPPPPAEETAPEPVPSEGEGAASEEGARIPSEPPEAPPEAPVEGVPPVESTEEPTVPEPSPSMVGEEAAPPQAATTPSPEEAVAPVAEGKENVEGPTPPGEPPSPPSEGEAPVGPAPPAPEAIPPPTAPMTEPALQEEMVPKPTVTLVPPPIPAVAPTPPVVLPPPEAEPPPPPSGVELTVGGPLTSALAGFLDATAAGHHGVCVVRESPERIRARLGSRPTEVFWLTNIGRGPSVRPADLEAAWTFLAHKLLEEHVTAFFLEGVEYLVRLHGPDAVLTGLVQFDRLARENDARVWVYLAPALMRPADLERFQSTFGSGSGAA